MNFESNLESAWCLLCISLKVQLNLCLRVNTFTKATFSNSSNHTEGGLVASRLLRLTAVVFLDSTLNSHSASFHPSV